MNPYYEHEVISSPSSLYDTRNYGCEQGQRFGPIIPFLTGFALGAPFWGRPMQSGTYPYPYPYPYPLPYPYQRPGYYQPYPYYRPGRRF